MPVSSQQMAGMIGGQQAMFGNFASYATQISPGYGGPPPTYQNPMAGTEQAFAPPPGHVMDAQAMGTSAISALGNVGLPAMASAAMFLPGLDRLDPVSTGLRHIGSQTGISFGREGMLSKAGWGNLAQGARDFSKLGMGGMLRTGMGALGGAAMRAMPLMGLGMAANYGIGQMVQGAQFQGQVQSTLQNQFRFLNPGSRTGFGFSSQQGAEISDMLRTMGHQDMMSSPQEMLKIMQQGSQQGLFRMVQDVKEFKKKFKETVSALKTVAKTMNTTLEGAMPFFQAARQQGFWTPADIQGQAAQTRATAATTGMSVQQVQQMQQQGTQMARQAGALGYTGAQGMTQALNLVGGGLRGGAISGAQLAEATGGLTGTEGIQSMAGTLQAATTRFATGRRARWLLAAMGGQGFRGLDAGRMQMMMHGGYSIGDIGSMARRNIGREGAFNFVQNEQDLRGDLIRQGPMAQLGFIRTLIGGRLYGRGSRDRYITRRMMQRNFGVSGRQADMLAQLARDAPQIMEQNAARSSSVMDQEERNREQLMNRSWEGVKRKSSQWWDTNVRDPVQKYGAEMAKAAGDWIEKQTDRFWGRTSPGMKFRGISGAHTRALQDMMLGDTGAMSAFTSAAETESMGLAGAGVMGGGVGRGAFSSWRGAFAGRQGVGGLLGGLGAGFANASAGLFGMGRQTNESIETMRRLGAGEYAFGSEAERRAAIAGGRFVGGATSGESAAGRFRAFATADVKRIRGGLSFATSGTVNRMTAEAIGLGGDVKGAQATVDAARKDMEQSVSFQRALIQSKQTATLTGKTDDLERAKSLVRQIRSGEIQGEGLRQLVGEAGDVSEQQAAMRLIGAQGRSIRGSGAALDVSELAGGVGAAGTEDQEEIITQHMEKTGKFLGFLRAQSAGGRATRAGRAAMGATQKAFMDLYNVGGKVTERFREGMVAWRRGTPKDKQRARRLWMKLALEGKEAGLTEDQIQTLTKMSQEGGDDQGQLEKVLDMAAQGDAAKATQEVKEVANRRGERVRQSMGDNMERILGGMDEIRSRSAQGGERELQLGEKVRDLISGDIKNPQDLVTKLQELTEASAMADPEQAFRAAEMLRGYAGGEHIAAAISTGAGARALTTQAMKGGQRAAGAASQMIAGLLGGGAGIDARDLRKLRTKPGSIDEIEKGLIKDRHTDAQRRNLRQMLEGLREGNQEKIMEVGLKSAGARAVGIMGKTKDPILGAEAGALTGRMGSRAGMHIELGRQTKLLESILLNLGKEKGVISPLGGQGGKDRQASGVGPRQSSDL